MKLSNWILMASLTLALGLSISCARQPPGEGLWEMVR